MKNLPNTVAMNIKRILKERNQTAEKLAYEIGMSKGFLSEFLSGKKDITLRNLQRIAEGIEVKYQELFKD